MTRPRPLVLWLGSGVLCLLGLCLAVFNGSGNSVEWLAPLPLPSGPVNTVATVADVPRIELQTYSQTWEKPLFNAQRRPDPQTVSNAEKTPSSLKGLTLTGVIAAGAVRKAFFRNGDGQQLAALEQQTLPNGWQLERIGAQHVSLTLGNDTKTLTLRVLKVPQTPPTDTARPLLSPSLPNISKDSAL